MRSMRLLDVSVFSFFLPYLILGSSDRSHNAIVRNLFNGTFAIVDWLTEYESLPLDPI